MSSMPIRKRGNFFKDDYFHDFHNDFDNAMDKVMDKFGGRSLLADQFTNSRKLKRENSQVAGAASISDTGDNYLIVLDMSDFLSGSITVSTSGKNAVVEANFEEKKFFKKFPLPSNCNIDGVKSAMSDDGILTINAPKKVGRKIQVPAEESNQEKLSEASNIPKMEENAANAEKGRITVECMNFSKKLDDTASQSVPQTPTETRRVSIDRRGHFFQDSKFENVWSDFEKSMEDMIQVEKSKEANREAARAARRARRDAVFENITKQFFGNVSPRNKDNFFENETKSREKMFDSEKKKHKSFDEEIDSIREKFFGEDLPKKKDPFFEDFSKRKENFFEDDYTRSKSKFFEDNSARRNKFFDDNSTTRRGNIFEDDSQREIEEFFKDTPTRRKDRHFEDDYNRRDNLKDGSSRRDKFFKDHSDDDHFSSNFPRMDRFNKYRNLRNWDSTPETQAVSVKQSSDCYKILLDAKGVDSNSISVQAKDDGLLVSGGEGRKSFKRKFSLPGAISFDKVNAALSEDGILIITIPKN